MTLYVIRHKPSGQFMPEAGGKIRFRGGYTHWEPRDYADLPVDSIPPRLFTREQDAKTALTWWLNGVASVSGGHDYFGEYDEQWHVDAKPERRREDMEIVKMKLVEESEA